MSILINRGQIKAIGMMFVILPLFAACTAEKNTNVFKELSTRNTMAGKNYKQELTKAKDWESVYYVDGGIFALKKDGSLWEFSKIKKSNTGLVIIEPGHVYKKRNTYHLMPKEVISNGALNKENISIGNNRMYVITKSGTLMGLGREIRKNNYFDFLTPIDPIGEFLNWDSVKTVGNSEASECGEHTLGFTKDGVLHAVSDKSGEFLEFLNKDSMQMPVPMAKEWQKVMMGCYVDYGMKKDGTLWQWGVDNGTSQRVEDIVLQKQIAKAMSQSQKKIFCFYVDLNSTEGCKNDTQKGILSDGTLWLLPEIMYE